MSFRLNQNFQFWKEVEGCLRSKKFTCCGDPVFGPDVTTVSQVYTLWCLVIQDLCGASRLRSDKALRAWIFQVGEVPIDQIVETLKSILCFLRDYNRDMGERVSITAFKRLCESWGGFGWMLAHCVGDLLESFFEKCEPETLHILLSCFEFPCRMTLHTLPSLEALEVKKYWDLEREMSEWTYPADLLEDLRKLTERNFLEFPEPSFRPKHGGGTTSERVGLDAASKYSYLMSSGLPPRLHHFFCQKGLKHPLVNERAISTGSSCRILLVPKGTSSKRVISCEPTANQWFQQALLRDFSHWLPSSPYRITMDDQTRNQRMAKLGSECRQFATIDLSSASDTVTNTLVQAMFKNTCVWPWLWSCRSQYAVLGNNRAKIEKFAPMGSAVCFPIESIIFSSVVMLAMQRLGVHHDFVVYGDDIVCHSSVYELVCDLLKELHFSVNQKKTFHPTSPFKESCGREYYYGVDVTPLRIPRFFAGWLDAKDVRKSPQLLPSWISLANNLLASRCQSARRYLVGRLLSLCPSVLFSYRDEYPGLLSSTATNYHLRSKYEDSSYTPGLPRNNFCRGRLVKASMVLAKVKPGDDLIRYQMLLEEYNNTSRQALSMPDDLIEVKAGPAQVSVQEKWIPVYLLENRYSYESYTGCTDETDDHVIVRFTGESEWRGPTV